MLGVPGHRSFLLVTVEQCWVPKALIGSQLVSLGNPDRLVMICRILLSYLPQTAFISALIVRRHRSPYYKLYINYRQVLCEDSPFLINQVVLTTPPLKS